MVTGVPTVDGLYPGIPNEVYQGDVMSLSHSGSRLLMSPGSPAAYRWAVDHPDPERTTKALNFGAAVHTMVLGAGPEVVALGYDDYQTRQAQQDKKDALRANKIPLLKKHYQVAEDMAAAVKNHPLAARLLDGAKTELSGWWPDPETGVRLRYRLDALKHLESGRVVGLDVKTADNAHPDVFGKAAANYCYHTQHAWYWTGMAATIPFGEVAGFLFIVIEKEPPYLVSVCQIDDDSVRVGAMRNRRAVDLYAQCLDTGRWPAYGDGINPVSIPRWALRQEDWQ